MIPGQYRSFFRSWIEDPFSVGALAPSGKPLARLLTREIGPGHRVVEFGPGTGTVAREDLARGVDERDLVLVERCTGFAELLERQYTAATIVRGDATAEHAALEGQRHAIDFIVSGLPLVLFNREQRSRLLARSNDLLTADGAIYQFTYGGRCPIDRRQLREYGFKARCIGFIAFNMPPAFVYRIGRVAQGSV